jgi:hypothetical protein
MVRSKTGQGFYKKEKILTLDLDTLDTALLKASFATLELTKNY